jgi:hypothetical protein
MDKIKLLLPFILGLLNCNTTLKAQSVPFPASGYTLEAVRLRAQPSTSASILKVLPGFDDFEILEQLPQEKIGNDTDHWYKVRLFDRSGAVGYLFGHFLSVRQKGRQAVTLKFTEVQIGDYYHYIFLNTATRQEDEYETRYLRDGLQLLNNEESDINPEYKNKLFRAIINRVPGLVPVGPEETGPGEVNIILELIPIK